MTAIAGRNRGAYRMAAPSGYSFSAMIGEDQFTSASLDTTKWNPWLGQAGGRWNGGSAALPSPYSAETISSSPYNAEYYDPYPYGYSTQTAGNHLAGGGGYPLQMIAAPSNHFSGSNAAYVWAASAICSTGKTPMIVPSGGGFVQVLMQIPDCSFGCWPVIWFLGETNTNQNMDWEFGYNGNPNKIMSLGVNDTTVSQPVAGVDLSQGYHIYGTKYVPGTSYTCYLDGTQIYTGSTTNTGSFEIMLGLQMANSNASGFHTVSDTVNHPGPFVLSIAEVQVYHN